MEIILHLKVHTPGKIKDDKYHVWGNMCFGVPIGGLKSSRNLFYDVGSIIFAGRKNSSVNAEEKSRVDGACGLI